MNRSELKKQYVRVRDVKKTVREYLMAEDRSLTKPREVRLATELQAMCQACRKPHVTISQHSLLDSNARHRHFSSCGDGTKQDKSLSKH